MRSGREEGALEETMDACQAKLPDCRLLLSSFAQYTPPRGRRHRTTSTSFTLRSIETQFPQVTAVCLFTRSLALSAVTQLLPPSATFANAPSISLSSVPRFQLPSAQPSNFSHHPRSLFDSAPFTTRLRDPNANLEILSNTSRLPQVA